MSIRGYGGTLQESVPKRKHEVHSVLVRRPMVASSEVALSLIPIYGHGLHGVSNRIRSMSERASRKRETTHRRDTVGAFSSTSIYEDYYN